MLIFEAHCLRAFADLLAKNSTTQLRGRAPLVVAEQVKGDPRVTVRLGTPISAYGQESRNRAARQRIPHRSWTDGSGLEHHQVTRDAGSCLKESW